MSRFRTVLTAATLVYVSGHALAATLPAPVCTGPATCKSAARAAQAKASVDTTLAASVAASVSKSVAQTLNNPYPYLVYASDYGMQCNGLADDTAALTSALNAAQANSGAANALAGGVKVILPGGLCLMSAAVSVAVTKSMDVSGLGIGATHLMWLAPTNGLAFTVSNGASLTVSDMAISKKLGTNPAGSTFVGRALSIAAGGPELTQYGTYLPLHQNVGSVTVANLSIYPGVPNGQTDSWAVGVDLADIAGGTVSDVAVNMPGWGYLPNPGGLKLPISGLPSPAAMGPFNNGQLLPTSGVTASGSSAAALGPGVADGLLLRGTDATASDPNHADYSIDTVVSNLSVSGGLAGIDLYRFQGAYISEAKLTNMPIGIRADTPNNVSELISVINSLFTTSTDGVYLNGVAGANVSNNYFLHGDDPLTSMPAWAAIWLRNGTNGTITANNINGVGASSSSPEYGIYLSNDAADGTGGFPNAVTSNDLAIINGICLGNDKNVVSVNATGNSMRGCGTYVSDGAANIPYWPDDNSYVSNVSNHPDMTETASGLQLPEALTVGSFADVGSIKVLANNVQTFLLDGVGNLTTAGTLSAAGNISTGGSITSAGSLALAGGLVMNANSGHVLAEEATGGWGNGGSLITMVPGSGKFPITAFGDALLTGELYCTAGGFEMAWRILGEWLMNGTGATLHEFQAVPETDPGTTWSLQTLSGAVVPQPIASSPGVQVSIAPSFSMTLDCSADLHQLITN